MNFTDKLATIVKDDSGQFATERLKKILNISRTKQHICKLRHANRYFGLLKSCFLANTPKSTHHPEKEKVDLFRENMYF
jgi:hypothetical protein